MRRPQERWVTGLVTAVVALLVVAAVILAWPEPSDRGASPSTSTAPSTAPGTASSAPTGATSTEPPPTSPSTAATTAPLSTDPAVVVRQGPAGAPVVALTFDGGSDAGYAASILATLAANDVPATFGITGAFARAHPDLLRAMVAGGHQLLNHTDEHLSFTGQSTGTAPLTRDERIDQLVRADAAIRAAGAPSTVGWFRPPYGDEDASVRADVGSIGYRYEVLWTVDSLGWKGLSAAEIRDRCLAGVEPGAIYLMHVGSASLDGEALQPLIDGLRAQGYDFATVADLLDA